MKDWTRKIIGLSLVALFAGPVKRGPDVVFPVRLPYFYEKNQTNNA